MSMTPEQQAQLDAVRGTMAQTLWEQQWPAEIPMAALPIYLAQVDALFAAVPELAVLDSDQTPPSNPYDAYEWQHQGGYREAVRQMLEAGWRRVLPEVEP